MSTFLLAHLIPPSAHPLPRTASRVIRCKTFGSKSPGLSSCVPVVAPLSCCPPGDRRGHTLEVHRGRARADRPFPCCQRIFPLLLSLQGALEDEGVQSDHLSRGRGGAGRAYPMEHYRRQLERRTAAVLPRPYRSCCINADQRADGRWWRRRGSLGSSRVILLHQSDKREALRAVSVAVDYEHTINHML